MIISRRDIHRAAIASAAALGLDRLRMAPLLEALAATSAPLVLWLQGASCCGCTVSFLNHVSATAPRDAADVLITSVNLAYQPTLMGATGRLAYDAIQGALASGRYILVVEGAIPTGFGGQACTVWREPGVGPTTCRDALAQLAPSAIQILCFGTCASWGGVPATSPNPATVEPASAIGGAGTVHIGGCPPHPDWMVWAILNAISGTIGTRDASGRPAAIYGSRILHNSCVREPNARTVTYGQDTYCLRYLGCRGPATYATCPTKRWNGGVSYCQEANTLCLGCVEPGFPGTAPLRTQTTTPSTTASRVNCGGAAYTDAPGNTWIADAGFNCGTPRSVATTIQGTTDQALYQTWRLGPKGETLAYTFKNVPNGNRTVTLKFDETYWNAPGKRLFHVVINNQTVLSRFDIFAAAGKTNTAVDRQIPVAVSAGQITIEFVPVADCPKICAIGIAAA